MPTNHFRFRLDRSPDADAAVKAWRETGGGSPVSVERLVEAKSDKVYRSGIFRLNGVGPGGTAVVAKHGASRRLSTEALVYADVLPKLSLPAPTFYGYVDEGMKSWLFMEEVIGETFSHRSPLHVELAVRWLAALHCGTSRLDLADRLPAEGPEQYLKYLTSAHESIVSSLDTLAWDAKQTLIVLLETMGEIESAWRDACERCTAIPQCLVHTDFVNKNVVIVPRGERSELIALDWGIAGWGVPAQDLEYVDPSDYFALVNPIWPHLRLADIYYLRAVGVIMRHLGLVDVWAACLRGEPDWAMERLSESAASLAAAVDEIQGGY
jgi:hypothetical protein